MDNIHNFTPKWDFAYIITKIVLRSHNEIDKINYGVFLIFFVNVFQIKGAWQSTRRLAWALMIKKQFITTFCPLLTYRCKLEPLIFRQEKIQSNHDSVIHMLSCKVYWAFRVVSDRQIRRPKSLLHKSLVAYGLSLRLPFEFWRYWYWPFDC